MKNLSLLLAIVFMAISFTYAQTNGSGTKDENPNAPEITFKNNTHNFGELKEGPKATYEFEFTNTGGPLNLLEYALLIGF